MSNFKRLFKRADENKLSAHIKTSLSVGLFGLLVGATAPVLADSEVMIIQVSDLHGNMVPHAGIIETADGDEYAVTQGGGLAKVATVIN